MSGSVEVCLAEPSFAVPTNDEYSPNGIIVLDGSYVLNVGEMHVNITNHGLIGSQYTIQAPYSDAPSAQWPGGSGHEYLWGAGLWVGGTLQGERLVSTGQYDREFRPGLDLSDTIYEARNGHVIRPTPNMNITGSRMPDPFSDDDYDLVYDEECLNGKDDDNDGLIDEDFGQIGDQMFTCTVFDNIPIIEEIYPEHRPLNLRVVQRAFAWSSSEQENIIGLDFEITNVGFERIDDVYLGFFVDCDIQSRSSGSSRPDDRAGFFDGSVRAEDGTYYRANIAYMMDGALDNPLPGCIGVMLIDHTTEFLGHGAPLHPAISSFRVFKSNAPVNEQGEPLGDEDRYQAMSSNRFDQNTRPDDANDLKFLISSGPFTPLEPGQTLNYKLALIIGDGLDGMLQTAVEAGRLGAGRYFNMDNLSYTGTGGRESLVCLGDFPPLSGEGPDLILDRRLDFMNEECTTHDPVMFYPSLWKGNMFIDSEYNWCAWVNMDNCEECFRVRGVDCVAENFLETNMNRTKTGMYGRETHYPWSVIGIIRHLHQISG
jgi:hypothetical protein